MGNLARLKYFIVIYVYFACIQASFTNNLWKDIGYVVYSILVDETTYINN